MTSVQDPLIHQPLHHLLFRPQRIHNYLLGDISVNCVFILSQLPCQHLSSGKKRLLYLLNGSCLICFPFSGLGRVGGGVGTIRRPTVISMNVIWDDPREGYRGTTRAALTGYFQSRQCTLSRIVAHLKSMNGGMGVLAKTDTIPTRVNCNAPLHQRA